MATLQQYSMIALGTWNEYLGNGLKTIHVPSQAGTLSINQDVQGQDVFVVRFYPGTSYGSDMCISAHITYGNLVVYSNSELLLKKGESNKDNWIQVNQTFDKSIPIEFNLQVVSGEKDNHIRPVVEVRCANPIRKFKAYSPSITCQKDDFDYGIIVDKEDGQQYNAEWYKLPMHW